VKALKLTSYSPHLLQMLTEDDFDRRVEFSEWFMIRCEAEPDFPRRILWTDEVSFKLNGRINRHNSVYWSDSNPHEVILEELNVPSLTVWAGIWSGDIVGPYFFDGTVTGESYFEMLREVVLPELDNSSLYDNNEIIWQQDRAPPHYSLRFREFYKTRFPEWIGRRVTVDCPPPPQRSCDFSVWCIMENIFFFPQIDGLETPTNGH
jgi:hypothetical protein